jgi:hypothetical protein
MAEEAINQHLDSIFASNDDQSLIAGIDILHKLIDK